MTEATKKIPVHIGGRVPEGMKTCFVISPIGETGSEVRKTADDLFELIIEPALEVFGFDVVRADKIIGSGEINNVVIQLVQNAELCIIDLTGHNANVFYELGRRHETGKPYIQLMRAGETLPFDVQNIKTLVYDMSSARSTRDACQELRRHVEAFETAGYPSSSSSGSAVPLAESLKRLEQKIDRLSAGMAGRGQIPGGMVPIGPSATGLQNYFDSPDETFMQALVSDDHATALAALQRIRRVSKDAKKLIYYAGFLARAGYEEAADTIRQILDGEARIEQEAYNNAVSSLVRYYRITDRESDGVGEIERYVLPKLEDDTVAEHDKALLANQLQMSLFSAENYPEAQRYALIAIGKKPEERAYRYNLSMIYEARGLMDLAEQAVDEYMSQEGELDADHLGQAIDVYLERGRVDDVRKRYAELERLDPSKAAVKTALSEELRTVLAGG